MNRIVFFSFVFLLYLAIALPCSAQVDIRSFIPKISGYSGTFEIDIAHNTDESKSDGKGAERTSTRLSERIKLSAVGYVYHPRLMVFRLDLSGRLTHRSFKSGAEDEGWTTGAKEEFDFRTMILPEHPYNLELYTSRKAPIILGRLARGEETITSERGAIFNYRKRPFSLNMRYSLLTTESEDRKTDNTRYSIRGSHTEGPFLTSLGYSHSKSSGDDSKGLDDNYFFTNNIRFSSLQLRSSIDYKDSEQKDIALTKHKSLSWREDLKIDLPWNFEARLSYNHLKTTFERGRQDIDETLKIMNKTDIASAELTHTLFKSLRTNISFDHIKNRSERGETTTIAGAFGINYTKKIPIGRLFANYSGRKSITERTGLQFNIREVFRSDIGEGEEIILQQGTDPGTVSVEVKGCFFDEDGNERRITSLLIEDENYFIDTEINPNRVTIIITSLLVQRGDELEPVQVEQCSDPDTGDLLPFEFFVTFAIAGDSKVETLSNSYSLRLDLFDGLISPYYQRAELKQKVLSGAIPFKPEDSASEAIGITFNKPPYTLSGEYSRVISETNPSTSYKAEAEYKKFVTTTLHLRTRIFFVRKNLLRAERAFDREAVKREVTEDAYGINIAARKRFSTYLNLSVGGSAIQRKGESESLAYSLRGHLTWIIGKLNLRAGATLTHSESEFKARKSERMSQFYYLKIERKLF